MPKEKGGPDIMEDSTTSNLAKILSNIDSAREMEEYLDLPEVADSFQTFPDYFRSLDAVQEMDSATAGWRDPITTR